MGCKLFLFPHGCGIMCKPNCACVCFLYDEEYDESWNHLQSQIDKMKEEDGDQAMERKVVEGEVMQEVTTKME
jgi:hypothetical protein